MGGGAGALPPITCHVPGHGSSNTDGTTLNAGVDPIAVALIGSVGGLLAFAGTTALVFLTRLMSPMNGRRIALMWSGACVAIFTIASAAMMAASLATYPVPILVVPAMLAIGWFLAVRVTRAIAP